MVEGECMYLNYISGGVYIILMADLDILKCIGYFAVVSVYFPVPTEKLVICFVIRLSALFNAAFPKWLTNLLLSRLLIILIII